jgi:hypothetical protein
MSKKEITRKLALRIGAIMKYANRPGPEKQVCKYEIHRPIWWKVVNPGMGHLNFERGSGRTTKTENKMSDGINLIFCSDLCGEETICNALWNVGWQAKKGQHDYQAFTVTMVSCLS